MRFIFILLLTSLISISSNLFASHIPGGNISYKCTGTPNEYIITMQLYVNCPSSLGNQYNITTSNDCGLTNQSITLLQTGIEQEISSACASQTSNCNGGTIPGIKMYTYQATITLPNTCDSWKFVHSLCCRNATSNLTGATSNNMYFETIMNSQTAPCDDSPYITNQPSPFACSGITQSFCPGIVDPNGDSIYVQSINPMGANRVPIAHTLPYSAGTPLSNFNLDSLTGCITFNEPILGNYVVTYLIEAYDNSGNMTGSIIHDFQFEILNCFNTPPTSGGIVLTSGNATLLGPDLLEICEGASTCFDVTFSDIDALDTLAIDSALSNLFTLLPGATITSNGTNPFTTSVCWTVPAGSNPSLNTTLTVSDDACPVVANATQAINFNIINSTTANPDITICGNQTAQLSATSGSVFTWYYTATGTQVPVSSEFSCNPCANPVVTPTNLGTVDYYVVSDLSTSCNPSDSTSVTKVADFTTTVYGDTLLCDYLTQQIGVNVNPTSTGYSYLWNNSGSLNNDNINNPIASPTQTTSYITKVTSPFGCLKEDTVTVTLNSPPSIKVTPGDTVLCQGESLQFDVSLKILEDDFTGTFDSLVWSNVPGATVGTPCIPFNGTALNFDSGIRELNTVSLNVTNSTSIDFCLFVANSATFGIGCENADLGEDIELNYSIDGGNTWFNIATYLADDWDLGGPYANSWQCFSIPIPVGAATTNTMFQWKQIGFYGTTIDNWSLDNVSIMSPSNTYTYNWSPPTGLNNANIANPLASPTNTTLYTVTLTDTIGCSFNRSQTITVGQNFNLSTFGDTTLCSPSPVTIEANITPSGTYSIDWSPGSTLSDSTITLPTATPITSTTYTATVSSGPGCIKSDTVNVLIKPIPIPNIIPGDTAICNGASLQFVATLPFINFDDNFDGGHNPTLWNSVQGVGGISGCGSNSGDALYFDGIGPREITTKPLNTNFCSVLNFCLFIGNNLSQFKLFITFY